MAELGERIRQVLREKQLTQSQLARLVGVKQQTISYICAPESPASASRYAPKIATVLGVNPHWLQSGEGGKHDPIVRIEFEGVEVNARRIPLLQRESVIDFVQGSGATNEGGSFLMTDAEVTGKSFAVEIEGESMIPLFRQGDRVVLDPALAAEPGDYVLAAIGSAITFRKFRSRDGEGFELVPLNDDWPTVKSSSSTVKLLGVMVEHRSYRKYK